MNEMSGIHPMVLFMLVPIGLMIALIIDGKSYVPLPNKETAMKQLIEDHGCDPEKVVVVTKSRVIGGMHGFFDIKYRRYLHCEEKDIWIKFS